MGPRPRGSPRHLPQPAAHPRRRGARARSSTGRERSRAPSTPAAATRRSSVAVATAMGRDDVGTPLHRNMGVHIARGVEPWRIFANYMGRADGPARGQGRKRPHGRPASRARRDGLAPAGDAAGRGRLRARLPHPRGEAGRGDLVRRGRLGARRHARGHELRRRPPAPGRLRLRQQPVGLLDPDPPRVRDRAPRRPRRRLRLRGRRRRRHRRARGLPRGEAGDREGAPGRRADADRERHPAHGGPRDPRRRLLRPQRAVRAAGPTHDPIERYRALAARAHRHHRARSRTRSPSRSSGSSTTRSSAPRPRLRPIPSRCSRASTPRPRSSTGRTTCELRWPRRPTFRRSATASARRCSTTSASS